MYFYVAFGAFLVALIILVILFRFISKSKSVFNSTLLDLFFHPSEYKDLGAVGERYIYRCLYKHFPENNILRNLYLIKKDGKLTETDLLLVTRKGIFVFESKNYSGWIFGSEKNSDWTQTFPNGSKVKFFNPIIQNEIHIKSLRHNLSAFPTLRYFSIIVFSEHCELKDISVSTENIFVVQRRDINSIVSDILSRHDEVITEDELDSIIEILTPASRPSQKIKKQHLHELEKARVSPPQPNNEAIRQKVSENEEHFGECSKCGSPLVKRVNKKTMDYFYGCKQFPRCKFTTNSL